MERSDQQKGKANADSINRGSPIREGKRERKQRTENQGILYAGACVGRKGTEGEGNKVTPSKSGEKKRNQRSFFGSLQECNKSRRARGQEGGWKTTRSSKKLYRT